MKTLTEIGVWLPAASAAALCILAGVQLFAGKPQFWPAPSGRSWQRFVFFLLFRTMVYGVVILSLYRLGAGASDHPAWTVAAGTALLLIGFGAAFAATGSLGWNNAFGSAEGLQTDGFFRWSRNPVYVATWVGLAGWSIVMPDVQVLATLMLWTLLYVFAVFIEERWMRATYGEAFERYAAKTPRFIGLPRH